MKNISKITLFFSVLLMALILVPNICNATTHTVTNASDFATAVSSAEDKDVIDITANVALTTPIEIRGIDLTINGNGNTITKDESWANSGANGTFITAGQGTNLTLSNIKLKGAAKYGAQAYNGGHLILDNVTVEDCNFGGILSNAGTVEVRNLTLHKNGTGANNGIEIAKADGLEPVPKLIMNGTLNSTETQNVVYIATNNNALTEFDVENTEETTDKIFIDDNKVVVTDANNDVKFISNENSNVDLDGENFVENVIITVKVMDKEVTKSVQPGTKVTKEELTSLVNLEELGMTNYTLAGFYSDEKYETEFKFEDPITANTTIYAKVTENPTEKPAEKPAENKDTTPKTGVEDYLGIAIFVVVISGIAIIALRKEEI